MFQDFEYYKVDRKSDPNIPLFTAEKGSPRYLFEKKTIKKPEKLSFKLGLPIPKKPQMADFHISPFSIISQKIYNVLYPLNISGIQLLPCVIHSGEDKTFSDYWAVHTYQRIRCIDLSKSECEVKEFRLAYVKQLFLDKVKLASIPLQKRLLFRLEEDMSFELYHASLVEAILETKPTGVIFTKIEEWNVKTLFKR